MSNNRLRRQSFLAACFSLPLLSLSIPALAQDTDAPTREELDPDGPDDGLLPPANVRFDGEFARQNCPFVGNELRVRIDRIEFVNPAGGAVPEELLESLSAITAPGGEQELASVCDIRDAANNALRRDGWIARVQVPQQTLTDTLQLNVIAARISEIRVVGNAGPFRDQIASQVEALQGVYPLNERDAERILLLANDVPGITLQLSLAPGQAGTGDVVGNLAIDFEPYAVLLNTRNYNSRRIGRETLYGRFEYYGLTGLADRTFVAAQTTYDFDEQVLVQAGHDFALGASGLRAGAAFTYAWSNPFIENLDLSTDTLLADVNVTMPVLRRVAASADLTLGLEYADQETKVGAISLSKDATRTVYLRGDFATAISNMGSFRTYSQGFLELRHGLGILGATEFGPFGTAQTDGVSASRPFGDSTAFVVRGEATAGVVSSVGLGLNLTLAGQYTDDPLLNFDEFSIGNLTVGRGYDPGANSGDRAIGVAAEVTQDFVLREGLKLQAFGFYDIVQVENLDQGTPDPLRTLESWGGGLRLNLTKGLSAEIAYAEPLDRPLFNDTTEPPARVLFSISTRFPSLLR